MDAWNTRSDAKWEGNLDGVDCFSEVLFGKLRLLAYRSFFLDASEDAPRHHCKSGRLLRHEVAIAGAGWRGQR